MKGYYLENPPKSKSLETSRHHWFYAISLAPIQTNTQNGAHPSVLYIVESILSHEDLNFIILRNLWIRFRPLTESCVLQNVRFCDSAAKFSS